MELGEKRKSGEPGHNAGKHADTIELPTIFRRRTAHAGIDPEGFKQIKMNEAIIYER